MLITALTLFAAQGESSGADLDGIAATVHGGRRSLRENSPALPEGPERGPRYRAIQER